VNSFLSIAIPASKLVLIALVKEAKSKIKVSFKNSAESKSGCPK